MSENSDTAEPPTGLRDWTIDDRYIIDIYCVVLQQS